MKNKIMEKKENKVVGFVKKHGDVFIALGTVAVAVTTSVVLGKCIIKKHTVPIDEYINKIIPIEYGNGVFNLSENSTDFIGIIDPIKLCDLSKLAETFAENTGLTMTDDVGIIIGYNKLDKLDKLDK